MRESTVLDALTAAQFPRMFAWLGDPKWIEAIGTWAVGLGAVSIAVWHHDQSRHKRDHGARAAALARVLRGELKLIDVKLANHRHGERTHRELQESGHELGALESIRATEPGWFLGLSTENKRL
jgi:hypothetical protein